MKKIYNYISAIALLVSFILVLTFTLTRVQGRTPEIFGFQLLRISSESMEPELEVGNIILSKRVKDITTLKVDDVITYEGEVGSYADKMITHAVAVEPYQYGDTYYLQTRGIANGYNDPEISEEQVIGKMVCVVPLLGALFNFFTTKFGLAFVLIFLAILFFNEAVTLWDLCKKKDTDKKATDEKSEKKRRTRSRARHIKK